MIDLSNLETIPRYMGEPIYPFNMPISADKHSVNGDTIQEIFLRATGNNATVDDLDILREYVVYFMCAPVFGLKNDFDTDIQNLDLDDLINICLENGLDPF